MGLSRLGEFYNRLVTFAEPLHGRVPRQELAVDPLQDEALLHEHLAHRLVGVLPLPHPLVVVHMLIITLKVKSANRRARKMDLSQHPFVFRVNFACLLASSAVVQ